MFQFARPKSFVFLFVVCALLILRVDTVLSGNFDTFDSRGGRIMYTAYNIWLWPAQSMNCLNYKGGKSFIPAGSEVRGVRVIDPASGDDSIDEMDGEGIRFYLPQARKTYFIEYQPRYHTFNSVYKFEKLMFSMVPLSERLVSFNELERQAIQQGVVVRGMSKEAVMTCYGRPDERYTRELEENEWVYHINRGTKLKIFFVHDPHTNRIQVSHIDEIFRGGRTNMLSYPESNLVNFSQPPPCCTALSRFTATKPELWARTTGWSATKITDT